DLRLVRWWRHVHQPGVRSVLRPGSLGALTEAPVSTRFIEGHSTMSHSRLIALTPLTLTVLLTAAGSGPRAQTPLVEGVLSQPAQPIFWQGRVGPEDAPTGGEPAECADVPCDHFRLKIDLPFGTFQNPH